MWALSMDWFVIVCNYTVFPYEMYKRKGSSIFESSGSPKFNKRHAAACPLPSIASGAKQPRGVSRGVGDFLEIESQPAHPCLLV